MITISNPVEIDGEPVAAASLEGIELPGGWRVIRLLRNHDQQHGTGILSGCNFSFGYEVENADGQMAFLKALDYRRAFREPNTPDALAAMATRYIFERELLFKLCREHRLSRVVRVLEAAGVDIAGRLFAYPHVDYLIFEMADGDIRSFLSLAEGIDDAWRFKCLRDVASALAQIHGVDVAHQDPKPSNIMHFKTTGISKIGDFGSATGQNHPHPNLNDFIVFGDPHYSPPELLYGFRSSEWGEGRLAVDLYLLGNLIFFLFGYGNATADLIDRLHIGMRPRSCQGGWHGDFKTVLPHLDHAFNVMITEFNSHMSKRLGPEIATSLTDLAQQLCRPNPAHRGHRLNRASRQNPYGLERFVSEFDLLANKAARLRNFGPAAA